MARSGTVVSRELRSPIMSITLLQRYSFNSVALEKMFLMIGAASVNISVQGVRLVTIKMASSRCRSSPTARFYTIWNIVGRAYGNSFIDETHSVIKSYE